MQKSANTGNAPGADTVDPASVAIHASLDELREVREWLDRQCRLKAARLIDLSRQIEALSCARQDAETRRNAEAENEQALAQQIQDLRRQVQAAKDARFPELERQRLKKRNEVEELKLELAQLQGAEQDQRLREQQVPLPGQGEKFKL